MLLFVLLLSVDADIIIEFTASLTDTGILSAKFLIGLLIEGGYSMPDAPVCDLFATVVGADALSSGLKYSSSTCFNFIFSI